VRSPQNVIDEVRWIKENMPQVKEIFFDDDTFTDFGRAPRKSLAGWASSA
jgi:hypothetical protein